VDPLDRFAFSQSSLQDFVDCPHRFYLRYIRRIGWPAIQAEPARENECNIQRGERFHRLVQQYLVGVPEERLSLMAEADPDVHLRRWWENFLDCVPQQLAGKRHVEAILSAPALRFRLVAKYDLVLINNEGCATIFDWKTSLHRPTRKWLAARLQTRVYPYLLVQAGADLNRGQPFAPEQVEMIYWFAGPQQPPERIDYSRQRFIEDGEYLLDLLGCIDSMREDDFTMAADDHACRYCVYRSLCGRGTAAGELDGEAPEYDSEAPGSLDIDLEQIGEISF